jgi:predicted transcriptional regulator
MTAADARLFVQGRVLRQWRKKHRLKVADVIRVAGCGRSTWYHYEQGLYEGPPIGKLADLERKWPGLMAALRNGT